MFARVTFNQAIIEAVLLGGSAVAAHLALELREPSLASAIAILVAFFLPPIWGALRLGPHDEGDPAQRVLRTATFGLQLGLFVAGLGAAEKLAALALAGKSLPVPLSVWLAVAIFFAVCSAIAYALIVLGVRTIMAVHRDPQVVADYIFPSRQGSLDTATALAYSLVPGLGHYYLGRPQRGAGFMLVTVELALAALCAIIAGLILVWEARARFDPFFDLAVIILLSPLVLVLASIVDVLALRPRSSDAPR